MIVFYLASPSALSKPPCCLALIKVALERVSRLGALTRWKYKLQIFLLVQLLRSSTCVLLSDCPLVRSLISIVLSWTIEAERGFALIVLIFVQTTSKRLAKRFETITIR